MPTAKADSTTQAYIGTSASVDVPNNITVSATDTPEAVANAYGVNGGLLTVGVSNATSEASPVVNAYVNVGSGKTVTADGPCPARPC